MEQEKNSKRIESIYQMLFEMAAGNFNFRIERTGSDDELEGLIVLVNMVAEELRANVFHNGYVNSHFTFQYLIQNTFILNQEFIIKSYNPDLANSFGFSPDALFDNIRDLTVVKNSFNKVVQEEIGFRNLEITATEVLEDVWNACHALAERDLKSEEFNHLQLGIRNFTNFTIDRFNIDEAITSAAKIAYLTKLIQNENSIKIERFKNPLEIKDWNIEDQLYNKINRLKKNNPEAFYYWYKAFGL